MGSQFDFVAVASAFTSTLAAGSPLLLFLLPPAFRFKCLFMFLGLKFAELHFEVHLAAL
jgi:hypothetical protein